MIYCLFSAQKEDLLSPIYFTTKSAIKDLFDRSHHFFLQPLWHNNIQYKEYRIPSLAVAPPPLGMGVGQQRESRSLYTYVSDILVVVAKR